jgi:hypothetical protein
MAARPCTSEGSSVAAKIVETGVTALLSTVIMRAPSLSLLHSR